MVMVNFRLAMVLLALSLSFSVAARDQRNPMRAFSVGDSQLAELKLKIEDVGEPVQLPYKMSVSILCVDLRKLTNSIRPKVEVVVNNLKICDFRAFNFDEKSKVLTIQYSTSAFKDEGPSECDTPFSQTFDLKEFCASWKP